ncbi:MAG: RDD family protein [Acidobacteria bacterium]|nr:MAG: RDD family protein [Acidobacteriota bacterium]
MSAAPKRRSWETVSFIPPTSVVDPRAGFGLRLEALFIDYILAILGAFLLVWISSLLSRYLTLAVLSFAGFGGMGLVYLFNHLGLSALTGQTVGKMVVGIRVVRADGRPLGWRRALGRHTLGYAISGVPLGIGFLWALWDSEKQAWHDKIFATRVVKVNKP